MVRITPKQQVLLLLDEALATGVRGRVATVLKHAKAEILGEGEDDAFFDAATTDQRIDGCPGLVFKVAKQRKRWIYRYTPKGKSSTRQRTLGYFPAMDLAGAKQAWAEAREGLAEQTTRPPVGKSVAQLVADYLEYARVHRTGWRSEQRLLEGSLVELFGERPADSLERDEIQLLLAGIQEQGKARGRHGLRAASRALAIYGHLFDVARGRAESWPQGLGLEPRLANPCEGMVIPRAVSDGVPPVLADLVQYQRALSRLSVQPDLKLILQWQIQHLVPLWSLCRLQWQGIDWQQGVIRVDDAKGRSAWLVLDSSALEALRQKRQSQPGSKWVFPAFKHQGKAIPEHYPGQLLAAIRRHLRLTDQFTATAIQRLGRDWLRQQGRGAVTALSREAQDPLFLDSTRQDLVAWQQHLARLRQVG